jgi:hypothetical protein
MGLSHKLKKAVPRLRSQRQDHIAGREVFPDKNFTALKPKIRRQANRLASAIAKQLCSAWHFAVLRSRYIPQYITAENVSAYSSGTLALNLYGAPAALEKSASPAMEVC